MFYPSIEYIPKTFSAAAPTTHHLQMVAEKTSAADSVLFASYHTALLFVMQMLVLIR